MTISEQFISKLRSSGLIPTRQRVKICEVLFNSNKTFHFTIKDLAKMIKNQANTEISLATVYNTVHTFSKKGYLKEIAINSLQSYFDTNVSHHHHFFDETEKKLIDLEENEIEPIKIIRTIPGKKIKSVEVLVKIDNNN
jgi:Fur family iron response transcriptional regulator